MIALLVIIYVSVILVLFKVLKIAPTAFRLAGIGVAGVLMIGGVVVAWMLCAPISEMVMTTQFVVQIVPWVKGQVKTVVAQPNVPLKRGDLLLEIDPTPYQNTVDQVQAQLKAANAGVDQAKAALDQAKAAVANAKAGLAKAIAADELAKTQEKIALNTQRANVGAISVLQVAQAVQSRQEADAAVGQAQASVRQAQAAQNQAEFAVAAAEANVPAVQAQLDNALFNLDQCKVTAPTDGYVVNWQVQPGTMLVPAPIAAAGTFVNTSDIYVGASFPQNYLTNVEPGDEVELVLDPYPGTIFNAKVETIIPASGGGQLTPSGDIPSAVTVGSHGLFAVKMVFTDEAVARKLNLGAGGSAAIYTTHGKPVHVISKVVMRMKKWLAYVKPSVSKQ